MKRQIGEGIFDGVDKMTAGDVLLHLQAEPELFPELQGISSWADLAIEDITEDLIRRLREWAIRGDYKGSCPRCPH